ncbi:unnamed protein product [Camellia sinensis]
MAKGLFGLKGEFSVIVFLAMVQDEVVLVTVYRFCFMTRTLYYIYRAEVDKLTVNRITSNTHRHLDIWMVSLDGRNLRWVEVFFAPVGTEVTVSGRRRGCVCVVNGKGKNEVEINIGINGYIWKTDILAPSSNVFSEEL